MTLLTLSLFLGMVVAIIGVLLCSAHIVELERRLRAMESTILRVPYKLERPER